MRKRIAAIFLSICMIVSLLPVSALAVDDPIDNGLETVVPTSPSGEGEGAGEVTETTPHAPSECTCATKCTEGATDADCPVCSAEGADLSACTGEPLIIVPAYDPGTPIDSEEDLCAALGDSSMTEITLSANITLTAPLEITREVTIDGGGYQISAGAAMPADKALIVVTETGDLTMQDVTLDGVNQSRNMVCKGTMELTDVVVVNGSAEYGAGILAQDSADVTLTNVLIQDNTAQKGAAGLGITAGATVTMIDSRVTNNRLTGNAAAGGGITCAGALTIKDGRIDHNRGAWYAGGILVSPGATFTMQGTAKIYANELNSETGAQARDVYVGESASVTLTKPGDWGSDVIGLENWYFDSASSRYPAYVNVLEENDYQSTGPLMATVGTVFTVTFDANGGLCDNDEEIEERLVWHNETVTPNEYFSLTGHVPANPTRSGYKFIGWYHGDKILNPADQVTEDITYTAKWVPETQCVLTFETNGGTAIAPVVVNQGNSVDLIGYTTTRDDYDFVGWYLDAEWTQPTGSSITMDCDKTVYAKWEKSEELTVPVIYHPNGGTWSDGNSTGDKTVNVPLGGKAENFTAEDISRANYRLLGWSTSSGGTELFDFDTPIENETHLYAIWIEAGKVRVTLDPNGGFWGNYSGKNTPWFQDVEPGTLISSKYNNFTVKKDYGEYSVCIGWSTDPDATETNIPADGNITAPSEDVTYYAVWRLIKGTIEFSPIPRNSWGDLDPQPEGTTETMSNVTYFTDETLSKCEYTRWGYEFDHWEDESGKEYNDEASARGIITQDGQTVTLYANYRLVEWEVDYQLKEGVELYSGTVQTTSYGTDMYHDNHGARIEFEFDTENGYSHSYSKYRVYYTDKDGKTHDLIIDGIYYDRYGSGEPCYIKFNQSNDNRAFGPVTVVIEPALDRYSVTLWTEKGSSYLKNPETGRYTYELRYWIPHGTTLSEYTQANYGKDIEIGNYQFPYVPGNWIRSYDNEELTFEQVLDTPITRETTLQLQVEKLQQTQVVFKLYGGTTTASKDGITADGNPYILINPPAEGEKALTEYEEYQAFTGVTPTRDDYSFASWDDDNQKIKATSAEKTVVVDTKWYPLCKIVFHQQGGSGGPDDFSFPLTGPSYSSTNVTSEVLPRVVDESPTKDNYRLVGWSYLEYPEEIPFWYFNVKYHASSASSSWVRKSGYYRVKNDKPSTVDVYAVWSPVAPMNLYFDTNGGTEIPSQTADPAYWFSLYDGDDSNNEDDLDTTFSALSLPEEPPTKEGYVFDGWYWDYESYLKDAKKALEESVYQDDEDVRSAIKEIESTLSHIEAIRNYVIESCPSGEDVDQKIWDTLKANGYIYPVGGPGEKLLRDMAGIWKSRSVYSSYDQTLYAKWKQVSTLTPGDVTIYTGGEGNSEFPKPVYQILDKDGNPQDASELKFDVGQEKLTAEEIFDVEYFDANGRKITNDKRSGDFTAKIVVKERYEDKEIKLNGNEIAFKDGTLRIRYVSDYDKAAENELTVPVQVYSPNDPKDEVQKEIEADKAISAMIRDDSQLCLNGREQYPMTAAQAALFVDDILPLRAGETSEHYENLLKQRAKAVGELTGNEETAFKYFDLVDFNNSNAWISSSEGVDVFWPYPDGVTKDMNIKLLHFEDLHREYRMANDTPLADLIENCSVDDMAITKTDAGIWFHVDKSGFSPFALVWSKATTPPAVQHTITATAHAGGSISPSGSVTVDDGRDKTFTIMPGYNHYIVDVKVDGVSKGAISSYTFYSVTGDHTIEAYFAYNGSTVDPDPTEHTLRYETNSSEMVQSETKKVSWTKKYGDLPTPQRDGYTFAGWYRNSTLTMPITGDVKVYGTVTIYAKWNKTVVDPDDTGVSDWLDTQDHRLYLVGYPDSTFGPDRNMTRAEVAQMFYALLLDQDVRITQTFSDVPADAWYATAVNTLASLGMMDGYPDGTFHPNAPITRAEFATVALAFAYEPEKASCDYYDVFYNTWYYPYVAQATSYDWIGGYPDGSFRPNNFITRAEVTVIVNNMLGRSADERYIDRNADKLVYFTDLTDKYWAYYTIMEATNSHDYTKEGNTESWIKLNYMQNYKGLQA